MPCAHGHHHPQGPVSDHKMGLAVGLTLCFVAGEAVSGALAHSLALLSDAGHNFADALALLFSWYALRAARRPSSASHTYGFHRVAILAALVNAVSLVVIALLIAWEAVGRLRSPDHVHGSVVVGVALAAMALNGLIA